MTWEVSNPDSEKGPFIAHFSYDVLSNIFSQLTFKECIRATRVCRTCYDSILRLPDVWREISDEDYDVPQDLAPYGDYFAGSEVRTLRLMTRRRSPRAQAVQFVVDHDCLDIEEELPEDRHFFATTKAFWQQLDRAYAEQLLASYHPGCTRALSQSTEPQVIFCTAESPSLSAMPNHAFLEHWGHDLYRRRPEAVPITVVPSGMYSPDVQNGLQELDLRYNKGVGDIRQMCQIVYTAAC
ncbi:hypothetical protein BDB00DRAFT_867092 [Zychaea mexicana]|uniref:uncharacterized protein n=1 Tax=Zychaea mexicana TaxID=64656 RepID=UPI0022FF0E9F|nr:uncharacterized protein BDB00DRAFT_867092 [Zychaea mexicana]KAI9499021.1 hypothetical protein BDB00DRAFT_867092 [Zychaea mexicana]